MATSAFSIGSGCRLPLEVIDSVVSAHLGLTRVPGNEQPACFNRQVAMYLAKNIGGWSTKAIGRFYHGRDHSTVCHGIHRIECLRQSHSDVDALISELKGQLHNESLERTQSTVTSIELPGISELSVDELVDLVTARVWALLEERIAKSERPRTRILNGDPNAKDIYT